MEALHEVEAHALAARLPRYRVPWTGIAVVVAAWTFVGAFGITTSIARRASFGGPPPSLEFVGATLESVWLWAAFTPGMLWLARRFPVERRRIVSSLLVHVGGALAFALLDPLIDFIVLPLLGLSLDGTFVQHVTSEIFINVFSYAAVVACGHALAYYRLYQARRIAEAELAAALAHARLAALKLQLRPHFLCNALHSAASLVRMEENAAAIRVLAEIGDLLRALLVGDGVQEVTIEEELEIAERCLEIERIRFGERLSTSVDLAPEAQGALVPSMILLPLVDNAIRHGIETAPSAGRVEIDVRVRGDKLRVSVRNTSGGATEPGTGIGLANTRERLERLYGSTARLDLAAVGAGMEALVQLPCHDRPLQVPK